MSNSECETTLKYFQSKIKVIDPEFGDLSKINFTITPNQICTVAPHKASCNGDSGGPIVVKKSGKEAYTLVGKAFQNLKEIIIIKKCFKQMKKGNFFIRNKKKWYQSNWGQVIRWEQI